LLIFINIISKNAKEKRQMSSYKSFSIQSKDDLCEWILRKLGAPLITIELAEINIIDAIDEAVEEFTKYANQERHYVSLKLSEYDSLSGTGFTLPDCCTGIFALEGDSGVNLGGFQGLGGRNVIFGGNLNGGGFGSGIGGGSAESWITYEAASQYVDQIKRMTASEYRFEYNNRTKSLTLIPDPIKQCTGSPKGYIVIGCNVIREEQQAYGESWVKRYALALSKITLGMVRAKFQGVQLLGGGTIDTSIKEEGFTERDALKEELKETEGAFMTFFVGG
jgi:hypothetical protein